MLDKPGKPIPPPKFDSKLNKKQTPSPKLKPTSGRTMKRLLKQEAKERSKHRAMTQKLDGKPIEKGVADTMKQIKKAASK